MKIDNGDASAFLVQVDSGTYTGNHVYMTIGEVNDFIDLIHIYGKVEVEITPLYDIGMNYMYSGK